MTSSSAEPIVSGPKAWTCVALNVLAAALVARELWPLGHRAFPKDVFLSLGSPMHFMSLRCKLLLACAVLHTINCVNFATHYAIAHFHATYNALIHRMIHALAGQPVIVLVSLATLQRCFALVILDGDARARRLWWAKLVYAVLAGFNTGTAAYWAVEVTRDKAMTAAERLDTRFLATWAFLPATCAPLACMSVCIWSIFKLRGQSARWSVSGASTNTLRFHAVKGGRVRSISTRNHSVSKIQVPSSATASDSQSYSAAGVASTATGESVPNTSRQSPYPIKRSLTLLNYCITCVWVAYAMTVLSPTSFFTSSPLSAHSLVMVYMAVIITLESSFEKLVKRHRKRRKPLVGEELNDPGWGMGGGAMSVVETDEAVTVTVGANVDVPKAVDVEHSPDKVGAGERTDAMQVAEGPNSDENPT